MGNRPIATMRQQLAKLDGERIRVQAKVSRFGTKAAFRGPPLTTICFVGLLSSTGRPLADHLWMTMGKQLAGLALRCGDVVEFTARSTPYMKGYQGRREGEFPTQELDYKLANPTKFVKIEPVAAPSV